MEANTLDVLQGILVETLSNWSQGLHVFVELEAVTPIDVQEQGSLTTAISNEVSHRGELYAALERQFGSTSDRISGMVEVRGSDASIGLIVKVDEDIVARIGDEYRWGNSITVQVCQKKVEGLDAVQWSASFFEVCARLLQPTFGHGELVGEYEAKNKVNDAQGIRAIGVDIAKGLPGLYRLNVYGTPYVEVLGDKPLMTAPGVETKRLNDVIVLALAEDGRQWNTETYRRTESAVLDHLGQEFFFCKQAPERKLKTIDLSMYSH